ncbi:hypothetical protein ACRRTK_020052 [Alexandromys fortis]
MKHRKCILRTQELLYSDICGPAVYTSEWNVVDNFHFDYYVSEERSVNSSGAEANIGLAAAAASLCLGVWGSARGGKQTSTMASSQGKNELKFADWMATLPESIHSIPLTNLAIPVSFKETKRFLKSDESSGASGRWQWRQQHNHCP